MMAESEPEHPTRPVLDIDAVDLGDNIRVSGVTKTIKSITLTGSFVHIEFLEQQ